MSDYQAKLPLQFAVAVDLVGLRILEDELCVLLVKRARGACAGMWALPGGFVQGGPDGAQESLEAALARLFAMRMRDSLNVAYLSQLGAYGDPGRDPRGSVVTVPYLAVFPDNVRRFRAGRGVLEVKWTPVGLVDELAFDHLRIVRDAVDTVRELVERTALAIAFCGELFTMPYLRRVYEAIWDLDPNSLDSGNFHNRIIGMRDLVERVGVHEPSGRGRPREYFERGALILRNGVAARLDRPIERPLESRSPEPAPLAPPAAKSPRHLIPLPREMKPRKWEEAKRRVREVIWRRALADEDIYYGDLASEVKMHWHSGGFFAVLDAVSVEEVEAGGPMVTALVMNRRASMPGDRFFVLAESLGRQITGYREFVEEERRAAVEWIRAHPERAGITEA